MTVFVRKRFIIAWHKNTKKYLIYTYFPPLTSGSVASDLATEPMCFLGLTEGTPQTMLVHCS